MTTAREAALAAGAARKTKKLYALVGMRHRGAEDLVRSLPDGEPLTLIRDPDNPHDPFAVEVWARERHVGFVKATQARGLSRFIADKGDPETRSLSGKLHISADRWPMVEVDETVA
jgi:hypothetical protein